MVHGGEYTLSGFYSDNVWRHVGWVLNSYGNGTGTWTIYLNGMMSQQLQSMQYPNAVQRSHNYLGKSSRARDPNFFGAISDFRLYSRVLNVTEIVALFAGGAPSAQLFSPISVPLTIPTFGAKERDLSTQLLDSSSYRILINNLQGSHQSCGSSLFVQLAEVQLFYNNVQLSPSLLTFTLSSTRVENGVTHSADKCNNGVLTDLCHTEYGDNTPSLTILSTALFDTVKVYNRVCCCLDRIQGASITTTVNGYSFLATFPQSALATYTFSVPSIPSNSPTVTQSSIPTVTQSSIPTVTQ